MLSHQTATRYEHDFKASQRVLISLLRPPDVVQSDDLVFLEFRPHWLSPQRDVYTALTRTPCAICMFEVHSTLLVRQHIPTHPPLCQECFSQLTTCPFCRVSLRTPTRSLIRIMWTTQLNFSNGPVANNSISVHLFPFVLMRLFQLHCCTPGCEDDMQAASVSAWWHSRNFCWCGSIYLLGGGVDFCRGVKTWMTSSSNWSVFTDMSVLFICGTRVFMSSYQILSSDIVRE